MTVYAVGMITITDRTTYDRYRDAFMPVQRHYGGRLLAADESPRVEEGTWPHGKLILIAFDDEKAYRAWKDSPAYRKIAEDRHAGSHGAVIFARGIDEAGAG